MTKRVLIALGLVPAVWTTYLIGPWAAFAVVRNATAGVARIVGGRRLEGLVDRGFNRFGETTDPRSQRYGQMAA